MGLVGLGKIAQDEHLPAIAVHPDAELIAVASRNAKAEGVANYPDLAAMLAGEPELDAIILCQPPQFRYAAARMALLAGKHVFLEKPPGATLSEVEALISLAEAQGVTLYASWHSRYAPLVERAKAWASTRNVTRVTINWKEDVRRWHPGQDWIWEAGGFGVFDPGINALSILTEVLPEQVRLVDAAMLMPCQSRGADCGRYSAWKPPAARRFRRRSIGGRPARKSGRSFSRRVRSALTLYKAVMTRPMLLPGEESGLASEYRAMYRRFVSLVQSGESDVDLAPLRLVADAFMRGKIDQTDPFDD